ncbi:MAG: DUF2207 domain-containing protein [Flavobacteriaceae bacterium]|jgi:uncharacterized membrane protein YgcG|nr:DUF2207 domain-containing protein [Flavobacteriaceae bacterium]
MKHFLSVILILFFSKGFSQTPERFDERIISFHSDIFVDRNSELTVTENIEVYSNSEQIQRGIFRALPLERNVDNRKFRVKYDIISISKNGIEEKYHTKIANGFYYIYIGNENIFLQPGNYDYQIKYKTENQIGFFEKYDELYWNVNGSQWTFLTENISATVHLPKGSQIIQNQCYTGNYGSASQNCESKILSENEIEWSASNLYSRENLTIAVGFKKGIMIPPPPPSFMEKYGILIAGFLVFLFLFGYYFVTWQKYGVDPQKPTVYPQFNSPENLSPASIGYIKTERFQNNMLTASLVNLAVKGFVKIIETEEKGFLGISSTKIFTVKKTKEPDESLAKEEVGLMNNLFSGGNTSVEFSGEYDSKIEKTVNSFRANLQYQYDNFLNEGNNRVKIWLPFLLITAIYAIGLLFSYAKYPDFIQVFIGIFLYVVLMIFFAIITFVAANFQLSWKVFMFSGIALFFILTNVFTASNFSGISELTLNRNFGICYVFIAVSVLSLMFYQYLIKRPSEEKLRKQSLIEGLEMYMGAAENQLLKFHNPPQMTPKIFETFLPFAMVLGVDAIWGKKFETMLKQTSTNYSGDWYAGTGNYMNFYAFGSALNSGLTQSIQSASTQPSSSGSGSGGGGFSGGGGGGGGGGGW